MRTTTIEAAIREVEDTDAVVIGPDALSDAGQSMRSLWPDVDKVLLVADRNTWPAAGEQLSAALKGAGIAVIPHVFEEPSVHADYETVERLRDKIKGFPGVPVAIGSGTINDLVKLASDECGLRYAVVATAASMDGYTSYGASITKEGVKQTIYCRAPRLVVADPQILEDAPPEMTAAGYADLLAKTTAGADWILADALGIEPIHEQAWSFVQPRLMDWTRHPEGIPNKNSEAVTVLFEGLVMAGLAMQVARSSRPASGAEHQFSHLWDMQDRTIDGHRASHGFKVGIGTLATRRLFAELESWNGEIDIDAICERWPDRETRIAEARSLHRDGQLAEAAAKVISAKHVDRQELRRRLQRLKAEWPELRHRLGQQLPSVEKLKGQLMAAGAPVVSSAVGVDTPALRDSYFQTATIRDRYTILDLAGEMGFLGKVASAAMGVG